MKYKFDINPIFYNLFQHNLNVKKLILKKNYMKLKFINQIIRLFNSDVERKINSEIVLQIIKNFTRINNFKDINDYRCFFGKGSLSTFVLETPIPVQNNIVENDDFANFVLEEFVKFSFYNDTFHKIALEFQSKNEKLQKEISIDEVLYAICVSGAIDLEHNNGTIQNIILPDVAYPIDEVFIARKHYKYYSLDSIYDIFNMHIKEAHTIKSIKKIRVFCYITRTNQVYEQDF